MEQFRKELHDIAAQVTSLEAKHMELVGQVQANTDMTTEIKTDTAGLVEFTKSLHLLTSLGSVLGKIVTWITPLAALGLSIWTYFKTGHSSG